MVVFLATLVLASGLNSDMQLVRPDPSADALPGMPASSFYHRGAWSFQLAGQYEDSPLVALSDGQEYGAIVQHRLTGQVAASWQPHPRVRVGASLPIVGQWQGEVVQHSADGVGPGDLAAHLAWAAHEDGEHLLTLYASGFVPTGRRDAWVSERFPHSELGGAYRFRTGGLELHGSIGVDARVQTTAPGADPVFFQRGSAGVARAGFLLEGTGGMGLVGVAHSRLSTSSFTRPGERVVEVLGGVQRRTAGSLVRLVAGRGLMSGVGSPDLRLLTTITWSRPPAEPRVVHIDEPDFDFPERPDRIPVVVPKPEPAETLGTRVEGQRIVVTEPILFFVNTAHLKPESEPAMVSIADVLAKTPAIGHLVVEGHASAEGSFAHNYDLSARRARSIWEDLLEKGVHPDRISYRGLGEVAPSSSRAGDVVVEDDRRVEFRILFMTKPLEGGPSHAETAPLPWTGETVVTPRATWSPDEIARAQQAADETLQRAVASATELEPDGFEFAPMPVVEARQATPRVQQVPEAPLIREHPDVLRARYHQELERRVLAAVEPGFDALRKRLEVRPYLVRVHLIIDGFGVLRQASVLQGSGSSKVDALVLSVLRSAEALPLTGYEKRLHTLDVVFVLGAAEPSQEAP